MVHIPFKQCEKKCRNNKKNVNGFFDDIDNVGFSCCLFFC